MMLMKLGSVAITNAEMRVFINMRDLANMRFSWTDERMRKGRNITAVQREGVCIPIVSVRGW